MENKDIEWWNKFHKLSIEDKLKMEWEKISGIYRFNSTMMMNLHDMTKEQLFTRLSRFRDLQKDLEGSCNAMLRESIKEHRKEE